MKTFRRIKVSTIHERSIQFKVSRIGRSHRCAKCLDGQMVTPEVAAAVSLETTRTIYRLVEAGSVHYAEDRSGLVVCLSSLAIARDRLERIDAN